MGRGAGRPARSRGRGGGGKKLLEALRWELQWGAKAAFLARVGEIAGEAPAPLKARPELLPGLEIYFEAFALLNGAYPGGIAPLAEIKALCEVMGIEEAEERRRMVLYLRAMETAHQEILAKQMDERRSVATNHSLAKPQRVRDRRP